MNSYLSLNGLDVFQSIAVLSLLMLKMFPLWPVGASLSWFQGPLDRTPVGWD